MSDEYSIDTAFKMGKISPTEYVRRLARLNQSAREAVEPVSEGDDRNRTGERGAS